MSPDQAWAELVRQVRDEVLKAIPRGVSGVQAEVTAVEAPDADGRVYATVAWKGETFRAVANRDVTLAVGNLVVVHLYSTDPVIVFRLT